METSFSEMTSPKYSIRSLQNSHFSRQRKSLCSCRTCSTSDSLRVLLFYPGKDQDVVQVNHHNTFHYEVLEDVVHHGLEGGRTVSHAKEHYQGFEQASIGPEGRFPAPRSCDTSSEISGRGYLFLTIMELSAR